MTITLRTAVELIALHHTRFDSHTADMMSKKMPGYQTQVSGVEQQIADFVCSQQNANGPSATWYDYINRGWFDSLIVSEERKATIVQNCFPILDQCPNDSIERLISVLKPQTPLRTIGRNTYAAVIEAGEQSKTLAIQGSPSADHVVVQDLAMQDLVYGLTNIWQHGEIQESHEARRYLIALIQEAYSQQLAECMTSLESMCCLTRNRNHHIATVITFDANNEHAEINAFGTPQCLPKYYATQDPFEEGQKLNAWFHKQTQTTLYETLCHDGGCSVRKLHSYILYGPRWRKKREICLMKLLVRGMFELHLDQVIICGGGDHWLLITPQQYKRVTEQPSNTSGSDQLPIAS